MAWFTRSFRALLWRNAIYRKRRWLPSLIEFLLPGLCVASLYFIKLDVQSNPNSRLRSVVVPPIYPDQSLLPLSFQDYATALRARRVCLVDPDATPVERILGLAPLVISGINSRNWPVPFVFCDSRACQEPGEDASQKYCTYRTLAVAGEEGRVRRFKEYVEGRYPILANRSALPFDHDFIQTFESGDELESYVSSPDYGGWTDKGVYLPKVAIGVVLGGGDGRSYEYTIRPNSTNYNSPERAARPAEKTTPSTERIFEPYATRYWGVCATPGGNPDIGRYGRSCAGQYMLNGAITVQRLLDDWILSDSGVGATVSQNGVSFLPFPTREYTRRGFYESIAPFAPLLFTLGLLYPVSSTIRSIVLEKELRQKELMKMLSVTDCDIGWSWFVSFYAFFGPVGVITAVFTKLLYSLSSFGWLLVYWQLTFIACIVYCFFIAAISTKATRATLIGIMLFFVGYFIPFAVDYQEGSSALVTFLSLHPVTAYTYGLIMMGYLEGADVGIQSTTMSDSGFPSGYTFANSLSMLLFDSILWGLLSWYVNRMRAGDYGVSQAWYFPITRQYWCPRKAVAHELESAYEGGNIPIEAVSEGLKQQQSEDCVHIHGLRKQFGDKTAVDGLHLSMYSGQITALLGHNGAGKTTTFGMLTGMIPPTSGYATVAGFDIRTDLSLLRENIGVCLQHDCLFPQLTALEHVIFFSRVKGFDAEKSKEEFDRSAMTALEDVALLEKRHCLSKDLSGGMKRKLSVAIAFCGDSKVVFLDEPTSGMDPFSRRFTWNVIRQYREKRAIILTTHFMEEADLLGDRIAIMSKGQLRCAGSSLFLKKKYGVGYQLTIIKRATGEEAEEPEGANDTLEGIVKGAVPSATLLSNVGAEVSFQLPLGESASFISMFSSLDEQKQQKKIVSYGVGITTLDEVFLTVARGEEGTSESNETTVVDNETDNAASGNNQYRLDVTKAHTLSSGSNETTIVDKETDYAASGNNEYRLDVTDAGSHFKRHVRALFAKRAKNFKRDKKAWCCSTILPTLISFCGFLIVNFVSRQNPNYGPLTLSLDQNNPDIDIDRNPIPFNNPGTYRCQPARCVSRSTINVSETGELYYFCGVNARVDEEGSESLQPTNYTDAPTSSLAPSVSSVPSTSTSPTSSSVPSVSSVPSMSSEPTASSAPSTTPGPVECTITDSTNIIGKISQFGAFGVGNDVSNVYNSSIGVAETSNDFDASMYGGIYFTHDEMSVLPNGNTFDETVIESCANNIGSYMEQDQCNQFGGIGYIVNYNYTSLHSPLLYQATADEALLRHYRNDDEFKISASVHPLPITQVEEKYKEASDSFAAWFLLMLSFPFIAGSFAIFIVTERESKAKHLQTVAGVHPHAYWLSTYCWDVMNYQIPLWTVIILMYALNVESFITNEREAATSTFALLILFGPAAAGFTYIICFFFKSPSMANLFIIVFQFVIGMAGPLICLILRLLAADLADPRPNLKTAAVVLEWILRTIPSFCLGKGLLYSINITFFELIEAKPLTVWSPSIALWEIIFLGIQSLLYLLISIQIDIWSTRPKVVKLFKKMVDCLFFKWLVRDQKQQSSDAVVSEEDDDNDVITENERVQSGGANNDLIVLDELTKIYSNGKRAVDGMSLGIPPGECFGLLGINGAGKTSTMAMLTAEFPPSSGDALLAGFSVSNEPEQTRRRIGYCPQFDAHFANMTGREHVELYAVIKGVPGNVLKEVVAGKLNEVGLSELEAKRISSGYSGGMKRKLSVACATIGSPQIVFLDEPSTGMDPVSRRALWKVISRMVRGRGSMLDNEKTAVILTTHSMEECEALCPRIGIMAGGKLRCLGSAQHLKNRFGQGYQIEVKVKDPKVDDKDVLITTKKILQDLNVPVGDHEGVGLHKLASETNMKLDQTKQVCDNLTEDDYLSSMMNADHPSGYHILKLADSPVGITVDELVGFCVEELRVKSVIDFLASYPSATLRERQDAKVRFEISSEGVTISSVFSNIEKHKEELMIEDYGVSQTSLEQVFNTFAAVAEKEKKNTVDGI